VDVQESRGSLLLLPTTDGNNAARVLEHSDRVTTVTPVPGPAGALATRTCAALLQITVSEPLRIIAIADGAELLPAVARSLHARSIQVFDYVLVEPVIPPVSDIWPDAPVAVFCQSGSETARMAGYRGWAVHDLADLSTFDG
jgi:hypothetical protein